MDHERLEKLEARERHLFDIYVALDVPFGEDIFARIKRLHAQKDAAYSERNQVVAALARFALQHGLRAGLAEHDPADTAWEADWRTILFVDLPVGQVSWHFHDSERPLLEGLPEYGRAWDGHSTEEKYTRLANLRSPPAELLPLESPVTHKLHCGRGDGTCRWREFADPWTSTGKQLRCVVHT